MERQWVRVKMKLEEESAKLLVSRRDGIIDSAVTELASFLEPGDRLVFNDTKVIPARLSGNGDANQRRGQPKRR